MVRSMTADLSLFFSKLVLLFPPPAPFPLVVRRRLILDRTSAPVPAGARSGAASSEMSEEALAFRGSFCQEKLLDDKRLMKNKISI